MHMDIRKIMELIPHRFPFLLVDKVISTNQDQNIHAIKNVSINEAFFCGHFPHYPVMPGVLIIEALAQASVLLVISNMQKEEYEHKIFFFASIENARFLKQVLPGDVLNLYAEKIASRSNLWKMKCHAIVGDVKVADATISAVAVDNNNNKTE